MANAEAALGDEKQLQRGRLISQAEWTLLSAESSASLGFNGAA